MNEFVWYSRLAVWAGALVLLAQAVSGRGASFMTPLATIALSVGFVCFLAGLAMSPGPSYPQESNAPTGAHSAGQATTEALPHSTMQTTETPINEPAPAVLDDEEQAQP